LYAVNKSHLLIGLVTLISSQIALGLFNTLSPLSEKRFHPAYITSMATNPFGLQGTIDNVLKISTFVACSPFSAVQVVAVLASVMTAVTLYQQRKIEGAASVNKPRCVGAIKVLLTNLFSFLFALVLGTPFGLLFFNSDDRLTSEVDGWMAFMVPVMLPLLSSVWNPVIFVSLTPKSRDTVRSLFAGLNQNFRVDM
jgi:hypothetical protein